MINYPIVRLYATDAAAKAALANLKRWGFEDELINVVNASSTPPANAPASAASDDPVLSSIMSADASRLTIFPSATASLGKR